MIRVVFVYVFLQSEGISVTLQLSTNPGEEGM
jgi:hypothetical protein